MNWIKQSCKCSSSIEEQRGPETCSCWRRKKTVVSSFHQTESRTLLKLILLLIWLIHESVKTHAALNLAAATVMIAGLSCKMVMYWAFYSFLWLCVYNLLNMYASRSSKRSRKAPSGSILQTQADDYCAWGHKHCAHIFSINLTLFTLLLTFFIYQHVNLFLKNMHCPIN